MSFTEHNNIQNTTIDTNNIDNTQIHKTKHTNTRVLFQNCYNNVMYKIQWKSNFLFLYFRCFVQLHAMYVSRAENKQNMTRVNN